MKAWLAWDPVKLAKVIETLKEKGLKDRDIETLMYYSPSFFNARVERMALPPSQLYWRVRAVFVSFGYMVDSKSSRPLFNAEAWKKANNLLKEILQGYYSDPPGFNFYTY